jgi:hypothetical protein
MKPAAVPPGRIVIIDDDEEHLESLKAEITANLGDAGGEVITWRPKFEDDVLQAFDGLVADGVTLMVTDYDLTKKGPPGFFGDSIVAWCQQRAIPVGDYSRGNRAHLPNKPNLFEFRFPSTVKEAGPGIAAIYRGFRAIRGALDANPNLLSAPSPANMLADMLHHPSAVAQFSMYTPQIGVNASLVDLVKESRLPDERKALAAYILGHVLFNSVLRYAGPILDPLTLCSYFAIDDAEVERITPLFAQATYDGPFAELGPYFWRDQVDGIIEEWVQHSAAEYTGDPASYRRAILQEIIGEPQLTRYPCPRCGGERGGYRCPFTNAVVCELGECSIGSSGWIPQGADLTRVERTFFDETAPMLGN